MVLLFWVPKWGELALKSPTKMTEFGSYLKVSRIYAAVIFDAAEGKLFHTISFFKRQVRSAYCDNSILKVA